MRQYIFKFKFVNVMLLLQLGLLKRIYSFYNSIKERKILLLLTIFKTFNAKPMSFLWLHF